MRYLTLSEKIGHAANLALLFLMGLAALFPFLHVLAQSLSSHTAIVSDRVSVYPVGWQLEAYKQLLQDGAFYRSFGVAIIRTALGTAINMTLTCLMAYSLSRKHLKGRGLVMNMVIFTMIFNGGMIPTFLLLKQLHLLDTIWSLLLPSAVSAFNLILLKNFFQTIPESLVESARIDGAGHGVILRRLFVPLSLPAMATLTLFYAVMHWNSYFDAVMYINNSNLLPLQVYLRNVIVLDDSNMNLIDYSGATLISPESLKAATIIASVVPMIAIYPFVQHYFAKGVMLGAVKE
ncbi:carbohydrate ABC transporter permease [Cohnella thermotolerans]|jgi:putative aldouronate transport system permease protein|uniref:carbohydrate ABC transporter permease n=1 Tax=Cohnella thermotolerans TaxID=329858 RepID=UPI00041261A2|nr:carbohydrate ABC transporter permease [Cohnella thermotolerans]